MPFFLFGGVMCVWGPVFASVGSGNIISVYLLVKVGDLLLC